MSAKKKILLLATGGTIASKKSENGLNTDYAEELLEYIPQIKEFCEVSAIQLLNLDSSNMEPEH